MEEAIGGISIKKKRKKKEKKRRREAKVTRDNTAGILDVDLDPDSFLYRSVIFGLKV